MLYSLNIKLGVSSNHITHGTFFQLGDIWVMTFFIHLFFYVSDFHETKSSAAAEIACVGGH